MTTEGDKCGLGSLLPMSCRGRAEAFARRLHTRLKSLGSEEGETSWLTGREEPVVALSSQPRHATLSASTDSSDVYFELGSLESPESPDEEQEVVLTNNSDCQSTSAARAPAHDSDSSDGPFYDSENDLLLDSTSSDERIQNGAVSTDDSSLNKCGDLQGDLEEKRVLSNLAEQLAHPHFSITISNNENRSCSPADLSNSLDDKSDYESAQETYTSSLNVDQNLTLPCSTRTEIQLVVNATNEICGNKQICSIMEEDDEETEERMPRVRRCSSLKTGKTPPGTPSRKKIVRFADVLGLDLADVRTFLDEIPKVPISAYDDLKNMDLADPGSRTALPTNFHLGISNKVDRILVPLFQQPGGQANFLDLIRERQVCLENAMVEDPVALSIAGTVRCRNLDFHKTVHIRYTLDSWHNFADLQATYVQNSCDGFSDKFSFLMYAHTLMVGQKLEFAVRFQCKGAQYWDNNKGANYCFQCLPATNSTTTSSVEPITGDDSWGASFY